MLSKKLLKVGVPLMTVGVLMLGAVPAFAGSAVNTPSQAIAQGATIVSSVKENVKMNQMLPASIRRKGYILIGAQMENAPDDYFFGSHQKIVGFEVNLANAFGNFLGVKIKYLQIPSWNSIVPSVQDGRIDMSMTAMNDRVAREQLINFVDYLVDGIAIVVKAGNPEKITGPASLCGKNVTVTAGTTQEIYLNQLNATGGTCVANHVTEVLSTSDPQEFANLADGRADATLLDNITGAYDQQTMKSVQLVNYPPIESGPYGMGFAKNSQRLENAVFQAMKVLMSGGTKSVYAKILAAWNVQSVAIPAPVKNGCTTNSVFKKGC